MKRYTILALAMSVASLAQAETPAFSFNEWLPGCFKLFDAKRDHAENPWVQEVNFRFRPQYRWGYMDPAGGAERVKGGALGDGRRENDEWRRFRLGAKAKVLNRFVLFTDWDIGGLDQRYKYSHNEWQRSRGKTSVYELYVQGDFKPVTLTLGKQKPAFIGEYRTSDSQILTIERSNLVNQLTAESVYGLDLRNSGKKGSKERFGSSLPARLLVRHTMRAYELVRAVVPARVARFVSSRFAPADIEDTAAYDLIRGSVNLTVAALLISLATSLKLPLSTTYVTFMVAMGSALADRAWGRESAVYRITGVLTVIGGWFLTAIAACASPSAPKAPRTNAPPSASPCRGDAVQNALLARLVLCGAFLCRLTLIRPFWVLVGAFSVMFALFILTARVYARIMRAYE